MILLDWLRRHEQPVADPTKRPKAADIAATERASNVALARARATRAAALSAVDRTEQAIDSYRAAGPR